MSRIFSVLSVSVLVFCLAPSAFGVNYHVSSQGRPQNMSALDVYVASFSATPTDLGSSVVPDTCVILYNDDKTLSADNGARYIYYSGNVTVESNTPGTVRTLAATDTALFTIPNYGLSHDYYYDPLTILSNYGGTLTISPDVRISGTENTYYYYDSSVINNGYAWYGGTNLRFQEGVPFLAPGTVWATTGEDDIIDVYSFVTSNTLNAEGVTFSQNTTSWRGTVYSCGYYEDYLTVAYDGNLYYYHDTAIGLNKLNGAVFSENRNAGGDGGALTTDSGSYTEAYGTRFTGNTASGLGGAIYSYQSILDAPDSRTIFLENHAGGSGGAIAAVNSALYLKGANFRNNTAQGSGGAIYFSIDDGFTYDLVVGAYSGSAEFSGNRENVNLNVTGSGRPSSIVFNGTGTAFLHVEVDSGTLNMYDPMRVMTSSSIHVLVEKTGEGVWNLGGDNDLRGVNASLGTWITILEGTFQLNSGATLNLANSWGTDSLAFNSGTTFTVGDTGGGVAVQTTHLSLASGVAMQLNDALTLDIVGERSTIAGTITGSGNLTKTGGGTLTFSGTTSGYTGNVNINGGALAVTTGKQFSTSGQFNVGSGATLSVVADAGRPAIIARQVDLTGAFIEIAGVSGNASGEYVLVKSNTVIAGNPTPIFNGSLDKPDYLDATLDFGNNRTELIATIGLTWNNQDPTKAHGTFTVHDTKDGADFTVGTTLQDRPGGPNWDGKSLIKKGKGTLELSVANTYSGKTTIEDGTLLLTHADATGTGTSTTLLDEVDSKGRHVIDVKVQGTLALDFDGDYDRKIVGAGGVLKQGDHSTTKLTSIENSYTGGTEIQGGTLQFDHAAVLGTGAITFSGGTLENTAETTLNKVIITTKDNFARFDTTKNLKVTGGITGEGGLAKTGDATLTLDGTNPYQGTTSFEQGTIEISQRENIGLGELVFAGGVLKNNGNDVTLSNNVRLDGKGIFSGNADTNLTLTGNIYDDGKLIKNGDKSSMLTLSGPNFYTGGTELVSGTIAFDNKDSLGSGTVVFAGGILKNTAEINGFSRNITVNSGQSAHFDVDEYNMSISSSITGSGGLLKTGDATLTLIGTNNTYTGNTVVSEGVLLVDGRLQNSAVEVQNGAALGGTGRIDRSVTFQDGSFYRWDFNRTEADSPYLSISGNVTLQNTYFQPVTAGDTATYPSDMEGWTVLKYGGKLLGDGRFFIDDSYCPFIDVSLNYDSVGVVKLVAQNRHEPRPLSDVMATSLMMAQRKLNRRPFEQIDNELRHGRYIGLESIRPWNRRPTGETRGQSGGVSRNLWGSLVGHTSNFAGTYYTNDQWRLNSFGVQTGYSFLSTNWITLGVTAGAELPQLKNAQDKVDGSDGHIGLYYGQRIFRMLELKGFIGGGLQSYKLYRHDAKYLYRADFHGDSFQTNVELARPVLLGDWMLRPYLGFDLEYASQAGAVESEASAEFRSYSGTSLTQLFLRCGLDFEKRLERGDFLFGIEYANMIGGQSVPSVYVYYPFAKKGVVSRGAELGHNVVSLRLGGNRYINQARTRALFVDYSADIFCDRAGGASQHNFAVGFTSRF